MIEAWKAKQASGRPIARGQGGGPALRRTVAGPRQENPNPDKAVTVCVARARVGRGTHAGWRLVRSINHTLFWQNHAPCNTIPALQGYNPRWMPRAGHLSDAVQPRRPAPTFNRSLSCIKQYTRRMQAAAPGKAVDGPAGIRLKDLNDPFNPKDDVGGRRPRMRNRVSWPTSSFTPKPCSTGRPRARTRRPTVDRPIHGGANLRSGAGHRGQPPATPRSAPATTPMPPSEARPRADAAPGRRRLI